jgi:hypothetical protein
MGIAIIAPLNLYVLQLFHFASVKRVADVR